MPVSTTITLDAQDLARIRAQLDSRIFGPPFKRAMSRILIAGQSAAREKAKPHSGDTGGTARSIDYRLSPEPIPLEGRLFSLHPAALPIDQGRRPGRPPPSAIIGDWLRRHGGDPAMGFLVARAIGRRGTRGLFFMRAGLEAMKREMGPAVSRLSSEIAEAWRGAH